MVNQRGISYPRNPFYIRNRNSSFLSVVLYVMLLFVISIIIFMIYNKDLLEEDEQSMPMLRVDKSKSVQIAGYGGCGTHYDKHSFWQDTSTFSDVFDELHFINTLQQDVMIVKELPKELESVPRARKHFTSWSGVSYYEVMKQLWKDYQIIHVAKSDSRLANNELPLDIQRLRCRALYHALDFAPSIRVLERITWRLPKFLEVLEKFEYLKNGLVLSLNDGDTTEASGAAVIPCKKIHCSASEI